jgi:Putative DNA-binding domain
LPIRSIPFDRISIEDIRGLVDRKIQEDRTLDFKQTLDIDSDGGQLDLLGDVVAMANASGGTLLYGAVEGEAEDRGRIVGIAGMPLSADATALKINNLLRDNVDERLPTVLHRAIDVGDGSFLYIIRIPASPRAPHMIIRKSHRPRFYMRGTVSNDPMNAQQIKEVSMRGATAEQRALAFIDQRTEYVRKHAPTPRHTFEHPLDEAAAEQRAASTVLLHFVPLYPPTNGVDLANRATVGLLAGLHPLWTTYPGRLRWSIEGLYNESSDSIASRWVLFDRSGAVEFGIYGLLQPNAWAPRESVMPVFALEEAALRCREQINALIEAGVVSAPMVISLRLAEIRGSFLGGERVSGMGLDPRKPIADVIIIPPIPVSEWAAEIDAAYHRLFDVMWQAWGIARSPSYDESGVRRTY